ncbi:YhgE/Pip family protein [Virgibacillus sp. W0430]|uniref:YhgE/Pip family protein n=1 Tax=Virgibacillus sp. W0430 TaxID=3391580 RepID=UPI003F488482
MKNSWKIYNNDIKNIGKNWVALILIGGLILLPSLYAWLNIKASWDPYGQTDQVPVGVVNEDKGATVRDKEINVGNELVETLSENDALDWKFTDRQQAIEKIEYGDYYAVIIIPENFSEQLSSVLADRPEKATIEYYVNEKINAIAPKITGKGASVIVDQISNQFIATVNGVIFDMFNEIGLEIESNLPDIQQFENYVFKLEQSLPEINNVLNESLTDASNAETIIGKAKAKMPQVKQLTNNGLTTIDETTAFLTEAENELNQIAPKIKQDLEKVQSAAKDINAFMKEIQGNKIHITEDAQAILQQSNKRVDAALDTIEAIEKTLKQLKAQNDQEQNAEEIDKALKDLARLKAELQLVQNKSAEMETFITQKQTEIDELLKEIQQKAETTSVQIDQFVKTYKEEIEPAVLEEVNNAKTTLRSARGILKDIQTTLPQVERILNRADTNLATGKRSLETVMDEMPYVNHKVNELAERIRDIQAETDINEIIELLKNDPEAERGFFEEPVTLSENKVFPIANYGTGMTPFYTVLAIWVGALLLISLLATDVTSPERLTGTQMYYGRYLTFLTIGMLQTIIVTLGDYFIIGVNMSDPVWFVLFGLFISGVFMAIVYTFVSVFGDVGKALAIILLVLQIAGSGGTYPVVLLPEFFQMVHPFLPFTYAVDLMREAVGGIVWKRALYDLSFLGMFGVAALILGGLLKTPVNKRTNKLMKKSKETGLFH